MKDKIICFLFGHLKTGLATYNSGLSPIFKDPTLFYVPFCIRCRKEFENEIQIKKLVV